MAGPQRGETSQLIHEAVGGFPLIEVTGHAQDRMRERDVELEEVLQAIRAPDQTGLPTQAGRKRIRRNLTARFSLDVVYEELHKPNGDPERLRVISTFKKARRLSGRG